MFNPNAREISWTEGEVLLASGGWSNANNIELEDGFSAFSDGHRILIFNKENSSALLWNSAENFFRAMRHYLAGFGDIGPDFKTSIDSHVEAVRCVASNLNIELDFTICSIRRLEENFGTIFFKGEEPVVDLFYSLVFYYGGVLLKLSKLPAQWVSVLDEGFAEPWLQFEDGRMWNGCWVVYRKFSRYPENTISIELELIDFLNDM